MFNKNQKLIDRIATLERVQSENDEYYTREKRRLVEKNEYEVAQLVNKHQDELARIVSNEDTTLANKTAILNKQISELTVKTQTQAKEIEMYTKAFENLGFDVKDMKDILNKLVDGLIAKNEIKLVK